MFIVTILSLTLIVIVNSGNCPSGDAELRCPYQDIYHLEMCQSGLGCKPCRDHMVRNELTCKSPPRCSEGDAKKKWIKEANGCSNPELLDIFIPENAQEACDMHDLCLTAGQAPYQCHDDFKHNLEEMGVDLITAGIMYEAVKPHGTDSVNRGLRDCAGSHITLYEGNGATQDLLCRLPIFNEWGIQNYDFQDYSFSCDNDEARSLTLSDVEEGTVIMLYDSPSASLEDDFYRIRVLQNIQSYTVNSFERDINDDKIEGIYNRNNGLDGKVSHITIWPSGLYDPFKNAQMVLYEGNWGTQNIVCTLPLRWTYSVNFKNDNYGCDNDETRSLKILTAPKGTKIYLYDDPDGEWDDDVFKIEVKKDILTPIIINSYESGINTEFVLGTYYKDNGLDGKVSRVRVEMP